MEELNYIPPLVEELSLFKELHTHTCSLALVAKLWVTAIYYHLKPLFSKALKASSIEMQILLSLSHFIPVCLKMTQAVFISLRGQITCATVSNSWLLLLHVFPFVDKMINRAWMCCLSALIYFLFLSCPGVVSEQKSSHPEVQRSQESSAGWFRPPAITGSPTSLPYPGERRDGRSLLLWTPTLLNHWGELWLHVWARAGKSTGRKLQPKHEMLMVPTKQPHIATPRPVVPVSPGDAELQLQPVHLHVSRLTRAPNVNAMLHLPLLNSRHFWFWVLGCWYGKQSNIRGSILTAGGLVERDQSGNLWRAWTFGAGSAHPPSWAFPAGDSGRAERRLAGREGTGQPSCSR